MSMTLIATATVTGSAADIVFSSIPQTFTDLQVLLSVKGSAATSDLSALITQLNGSGSGSFRDLRGNGSSTNSNNNASSGQIGVLQRSGATGFGSVSVYIPNYTGTTAKSISTDSVTENNATTAYQAITATLFSGITTGITSLLFGDGSAGGGFAVGSTASLYGILKGSGGATVS